MGRKTSNLGYQITSAVDACTAQGQSKRDYKSAHGGDTGRMVFGLSYKSDLCETGKEMARYIRAQHPDVRLAREIRPAMVQEYLDHKAGTVRSRATVEKIYSHVRKLDLILSYRYKMPTYSADIRMPAVEATPKIRDQVLNEEQYQQLKRSLSGSSSAAVRSVILSHAAGLRLEETAGVRVDRFSERGGRWGYGTLSVLKGDGSKGNRPRVIDIPDVGRAAELREITAGLQPGQLIVCKSDGSSYDKKSLTRTISRHMAKIGFGPEWTGNRNHSLRKGFAQACYDLGRRSGMSKGEALGYVNEQLGHSANRSDLSDTYVQLQW